MWCVYVYKHIFSHIKGWVLAIINRDGTRGYYAKYHKSHWERQMSHAFTHRWNLKIKWIIKQKARIKPINSTENSRLQEGGEWVGWANCVKGSRTHRCPVVEWIIRKNKRHSESNTVKATVMALYDVKSYLCLWWTQHNIRSCRITEL